MSIDPPNTDWRHQFFYPVIVAGLVGCCLIPVIRLCQAFTLDIGPYLMIVGIITTLQTFYIRTFIVRNRVRGVRRYWIAFSQISFLIVLTKSGEFLYHLFRSQDQRFDLFAISPASLIVFAVCILLWTVISALADQFSRIRDLSILKYREVITADYVSPYTKVMQNIFAGGFLILALAGFLQYAPINAPKGTGLSLYLPVYFLVSLVLLSQVNYDHLQRQWNIQKTRIVGHTRSRWLYRSLALIGLATMIAFLMPTGYTGGLLDVLRQTFDILNRILTIIMFVLNYLIVLLFSLPFHLLGEPEPIEPAVERDIADILPAEEAVRTPFYLDWNWVAIRAVASWIIASLVLIYVVYSVLKDNPEFLEKFRHTRFWQAITRFWKTLTERLSRAARIVGERLPKIIPERLRGRQPGVDRTGWEVIRLSRMTPGERVRYYYLSILHRASNAGLGRRPSQTPYEYQLSLAAKLTENEEEIESLTGAFIEARYSPQPLETEPPSAKEAWKRLRAALQRAGHQEDNSQSEESD
ncbi:MAG: DUF4129 domain-containing protein [Anaerolineae bacterium]|nr:DUF4129 domain-containing protein [Anaerolineae bacterium]